MADLSNAQCVTVSWDAATSQRVYEVTSGWAPGACYGHVLIPAGDFQAVLDSGGSTSSGTNPFTADEVTALKVQAATPSIFNLSSAEGSLIGGAILSVFAAAWAFKALIRAVNVDGEFER